MGVSIGGTGLGLANFLDLIDALPGYESGSPEHGVVIKCVIKACAHEYVVHSPGVYLLNGCGPHLGVDFFTRAAPGL